MPLSMRRQTALLKLRKEKSETLAKRRRFAFDLLKQQKPAREILDCVNIPRSTLYRIRTAMQNNDNAELKKLLSPEGNTRGRRPVLTQEENDLIVARMKHVSNRGFALNVESTKQIMGGIAADGREAFANGLPSDDYVRSWRARNRDVTFRTAEMKHHMKLRAENPIHVQSYKHCLESVSSFNPGIFEDADFVWNLDETAIEPQFGKKVKLFTGSDSNHGGYRSTTLGNGSGRHVTAVIAVSASGRKAPPIFIVEGKNVMSRWLLALDKNIYRNTDGEPHRLTSEKWLTGDSLIVCSANGSVTKDILPIIIEHLARFMRKFVPKDKPVVLLLDGHASRKGLLWLDVCMENKIEVVQSPANTSHFLQPIDQYVNKKFKTTMRAVRDELMSIAPLSLTSIGLKLMLGVGGWEAITKEEIVRSFDVCGLWAMNYRFVEKLEELNTPVEGMTDTNMPANPRPSSARLRHRHADTFRAIQNIVGSANIGPASALQKISSIMKNHRTSTHVIEQYGSPGPLVVRESRLERNKVLCAGLPAQYLTVRDLVERCEAADGENSENQENANHMSDIDVANAVLELAQTYNIKKSAAGDIE